MELNRRDVAYLALLYALTDLILKSALSRIRLSGNRGRLHSFKYKLRENKQKAKKISM